MTKRYLITFLSLVPAIILGMEGPTKKRQKITPTTSSTVQSLQVLSARAVSKNSLNQFETVKSINQLPTLCENFWNQFEKRPDLAELVLKPLMEDWKPTRNKPWYSLKLKAYFLLCEKAPEASKNDVASLIARSTDKFTTKARLDLGVLPTFTDKELQQTFLISRKTAQLIADANASHE